MRKKAVQIVLALLLFTLLISCAAQVEQINSYLADSKDMSLYAQFPKTKSLGIVWEKNRGGGEKPVPLNITGTLTDNLTDPVVIKMNEGGSTVYKMWFTKIVEETLVNDVKKISYRIGYAESSNGITGWTDKSAQCTLPGNNKEVEGGVKVSSVMLTNDAGGRYKMWYLGNSGKIGDDRWQLYYASSRDGLNWETRIFGSLTKVLEPTPDKFDQYSIDDASLTYDGTHYRMWYGGFNQQKYRIGYAKSMMAERTWEKSYEIVSPGFAGKHIFDNRVVRYPHVIYDEGVYKMWYSGFNIPWSIGLAYSLDGVSFDYYDNQFEGDNSPVLSYDVSWEARGVMNCFVIKDEEDECYKMWYVGMDNNKKFKIGYAASVRVEQP